MNADMLAGNWNQLRGEAQLRWGRLTNSDLDQVEGQVTKLAGLIQDRYGYSSTKAQREVNRFLNEYGVSSGEAQGTANMVLTRVQRYMNDYPWAFMAGAVVVALVLVGLVWKPFNH